MAQSATLAILKVITILPLIMGKRDVMTNDNYWGHRLLSRDLFISKQNPQISQIELNQFWNAHESLAGQNIDVYLVDTGVLKSHSEFRENVITLFDPFNKNGLDEIGHGTAIASLINGKTLGCAPYARLFIAKVFEHEKKSTQDLIIEALKVILKHHLTKLTAEPNRKSIVNLSLTTAPTAELLSIIEQLSLSNILVVIANDNSCRTEHIFSFENSAAIIRVAGINPNLEPLASTTADIYAPGENILVAVKTDDTAYKELTGNSIAAGFISGLAAALWSKVKSFTATDIKQYLIATADTVNDLRIAKRLNESFAPKWNTSETGVIESIKPNQTFVRKLRCSSPSKEKLRFKIVNGFLPEGLSLSEDGIISGEAKLKEDAKPDHINYFSTVIRAHCDDKYVDRNISLIVTTNFSNVKSNQQVIAAVQLAKCNMTDAYTAMNSPDNMAAPGQDAVNGPPDSNFYFNGWIDCCFTSSSLVRSHDRSLKKISEIRVNDLVQQNGRVGQVLAVIAIPLRKGRKVFQINNLPVFLTSEHPLYGLNETILAIDPANDLPFKTEKLEYGCVVKTLNGAITVNSINEVSTEENEMLYHLYVDGDGSYYVGDILTHRKHEAEIFALTTAEDQFQNA